MRRVAALYDIHGNLPALEAVLADVVRTNVDLLLIGGDVVPGPMPRESLELLSSLALPVEYISGNGERVVVACGRGHGIPEVPLAYQHGIRWTAAQLKSAHLDRLATWPASRRLAIEGLGDVLFCHATPRNDTECFTRTTTADRLSPVFAGVDADLVVCGHTHMPFDRRVEGRRVVNAGSVGMPFLQPAGAYWLLLDGDVELRRTHYDFEAAAARMRATTFPIVGAAAVRYVISPPTEAESLERFAAVEVR